MPSSSPWLVVGLGNPGARYANNRHNIGFRVVDQWLARHTATPGWRTRWDALTTTITGERGRWIVLKPQGYMNRSGKSVAAAADFHQIEPESIVVIHDELDFDLGRVAAKVGGGPGGHNGLRDVIANLGSKDFCRIRCGIGRPTHGAPTDWVLGDFAPHEHSQVAALLDLATEVLETVLEQGIVDAMNRFNRPPER